ncbi:MAG: replication initiator protein [Microviridae sp.]|nr:MAG: replication initiator protein [Microviridae sp.]
MLSCTDPFLSTHGAFPCGKCPACLSTRRRTWAHRIMLETRINPNRSTFLTLTYAEEKCPRTSEGFGTLELKHLQDFWKRLRKNTGLKLRYFAVGEYGELSVRPHYHAALWGLAPCAGSPIIKLPNKGGLQCRCTTCSVVRTSWGFGHVMVGSLTEKSAMYIAGYVVKKMTNSQDPRLNGRAPEFSRMSLKPGIGANAMQEAASTLRQYSLPVPSGFRHERKILPLGRYLRRRLATLISDGTPEGIQKALNTEIPLRANFAAVRTLRQYAWANELHPKEVLKTIIPEIQPARKKETL